MPNSHPLKRARKGLKKNARSQKKIKEYTRYLWENKVTLYIWPIILYFYIAYILHDYIFWSYITNTAYSQYDNNDWRGVLGMDFLSVVNLVNWWFAVHPTVGGWGKSSVISEKWQIWEKRMKKCISVIVGWKWLGQWNQEFMHRRRKVKIQHNRVFGSWCVQATHFPTGKPVRKPHLVRAQ